jgi:malonyl CoA-acyl carrier protein transacylase
MIADGATLFTEVGPGKVLAGLIAKIDRVAALQMRNCTQSPFFVFNFTYSINQTFFRKPSL